MQHPAATCATHFAVHGEGGMLLAVECAEYDYSEFLRLYAFSYNNAEFVSPGSACRPRAGY